MRKLFLASTVLMAVSWAAGAQTITPGNGTLTDAAGNVWLITANGSIQENGQWTPGGGGTAALTIANGTVYGEDATGKGWFALSGSGQYWISSPTPPGQAAIPAAATASPGTQPTVPAGTTAAAATTAQTPCPSSSSAGGTGAFHVSGAFAELGEAEVGVRGGGVGGDCGLELALGFEEEAAVEVFVGGAVEALGAGGSGE